MQVEVRLFARFRKGRPPRQKMDVPDGAVLRDVIVQLGLPVEQVTLPLVNGRHCDLDKPLQADDVLALFPALAGG